MTAQLDLFAAVAEPLREPAPTYSAVKEDQPKEWRFTWRGLHVIGTAGPCFAIDKAKHPEGTPCWSHTGFRSFCGDAWRLAGTSNGRSISEWSVAILDAYFAAPAKDGNGLGGQLVPWERQMWDRDDDEPAKEAPPAPAPRHDEPQPYHPIIERLLADDTLCGYSLGFGYHQRDPRHRERHAPWNAPSRLFQFPCTVIAERGGAAPRLVVESDRLLDHPFVKELVAAGMVAEIKQGRAYGTYHHAVDLISAGEWRQLVQLADYSSADDILSAVDYGLDYGHLTGRDAKQLLDAVGLHLPTTPTTPIHALRAVELRESKDETGKPRRNIQWMLGPGNLANTWGRIAGLERGWFEHDKRGFVRWTDKAVTEQRNLKAAAGEQVAPAPVPEGCLI